MAVADTFRVELVWKMGGIDFAVNVLHYTSGATDPLTQADADAFASNLDSSLTASGLLSRYSTATSLDRIVMRDLRTDGNGPLTSVIDADGTQATNPGPAQTCVVTTLRTTNGSRRGRGRIYWPTPHSNNTDATGQLTTAAQTDYNDFMTAILDLGTSGLGVLDLGVYSRADDITRTVTSFTTDLTFDVQTRRRDLSIV